MSKRTRHRPSRPQTPPPPQAIDRFTPFVSPTGAIAGRLSDRTRFVLFRLLPFLVMLGMFLFLLASTATSADAIRVGSTSVDNRWPQELVFKITATSDAANITGIAVQLQVGSGSASQRGRAEFQPGRTVDGEYVMRTRGSYYLPVGTDIEYAFEITDAAGNRLTTPKTKMMYLDPRFTWNSVKSSRIPVTAWYYGTGERAAQTSLRAVEGAAVKMQQKAGMSVAQPFKLILYNSREHWQEAQRTRSETQERDLILLGTAHGDHDLVLVLADPALGDPSDTAAHEATHLFVHWAAGNGVSAWLNEGLAVYAQARLDTGYLSYLQNAIRQDRVYPLRGLETLPGRPDENIAGYGQAFSVVDYLITDHSPEKMRSLLAALKNGRSIDEALKEVYGFDRDGLDAKWRESVGATARQYDFSAPTPIAVPNVAPMGVQQSSGAQSGGSQGSQSGVAASNPAGVFTLLGAGLIGFSLLAAVGFGAVRMFRKS